MNVRKGTPPKTLADHLRTVGLVVVVLGGCLAYWKFEKHQERKAAAAREEDRKIRRSKYRGWKPIQILALVRNDGEGGGLEFNRVMVFQCPDGKVRDWPEKDTDIDPRLGSMVGMLTNPEGKHGWDQGETYLSIPESSDASAIHLAASHCREQVRLKVGSLRQELASPTGGTNPPSEIQRRIEVLEAALARPVYVEEDVLDPVGEKVTAEWLSKQAAQAKRQVTNGMEYLPIRTVFPN